MPADRVELSTALIALTANGVRLALQIQTVLPAAAVYVPFRHRFALACGATGFTRLRQVFPELWRRHRRIVCIMAAGIVVRLAAPLIRGKLEDPALVVVDERGQFVISLLSGHLGGANQLAREVAAAVGGQPVITTASDVENRPALDLIARNLRLRVENPELLARLERAILEEEPIALHDPHGCLAPSLIGAATLLPIDRFPPATEGWAADSEQRRVGIWVSEQVPAPPGDWLLLRPPRLVVGIGCNRGTEADEILQLIDRVLNGGRLSPLAVRNLASIDLKADEPGLLEAARRLRLPIRFFPRERLATVAVPNPSATVAAHTGVPSVCEASALLSAASTTLLIPKQKSRNATVAVSLVGSTSSASDPDHATT